MFTAASLFGATVIVHPWSKFVFLSTECLADQPMLTSDHAAVYDILLVQQ